MSRGMISIVKCYTYTYELCTVCIEHNINILKLNKNIVRVESLGTKVLHGSQNVKYNFT